LLFARHFWPLAASFTPDLRSSSFLPCAVVWHTRVTPLRVYEGGSTGIGDVLLPEQSPESCERDGSAAQGTTQKRQEAHLTRLSQRGGTEQ